MCAEPMRHFIPEVIQLWGTVLGSDDSTVMIDGLANLAGLGDTIEIDGPDGAMRGEVIALNGRTRSTEDHPHLFLDSHSTLTQ